MDPDIYPAVAVDDGKTAGLAISFIWSFISHLSKPVLFWSWLSSRIFCLLQHRLSQDLLKESDYSCNLPKLPVKNYNKNNRKNQPGLFYFKMESERVGNWLLAWSQQQANSELSGRSCWGFALREKRCLEKRVEMQIDQRTRGWNEAPVSPSAGCRISENLCGKEEPEQERGKSQIFPSHLGIKRDCGDRAEGRPWLCFIWL